MSDFKNSFRFGFSKTLSIYYNNLHINQTKHKGVMALWNKNFKTTPCPYPSRDFAKNIFHRSGLSIWWYCENLRWFGQELTELSCNEVGGKERKKIIIGQKRQNENKKVFRLKSEDLKNNAGKGGYVALNWSVNWILWIKCPSRGHGMTIPCGIYARFAFYVGCIELLLKKVSWIRLDTM